jgi:hypothetical protein
MVVMRYTDEKMRTTLECLDLTKMLDITKYTEKLIKIGDKVQFCYDETNDIEYWISMVGIKESKEKQYRFTKKTFIHCPLSFQSVIFTIKFGRIIFDPLTKVSVDFSQKYRDNPVFRRKVRDAAKRLTRECEKITFHRMANGEYALELVNGTTKEYRVIERQDVKGSTIFAPYPTEVFQLVYENPKSKRRTVKCC